MNPTRPLVLAFFLLVEAVALAKPAVIPDKVISLFNGKDLTSFDTWLVDLGRTDPCQAWSMGIRIGGEDRGGSAKAAACHAQHRLVVVPQR